MDLIWKAPRFLFWSIQYAAYSHRKRVEHTVLSVLFMKNPSEYKLKSDFPIDHFEILSELSRNVGRMIQNYAIYEKIFVDSDFCFVG